MKVSDIARLLEGKPAGDLRREIRDVAALADAGPEELAFAEGERGAAQARQSRAGCILAEQGAALEGRTWIAVRSPKAAFIRAAQLLRPPAPVRPGIHPTAVIDPQAEIAPDVSVGPYAVIESGVKVGSGTQLGAGVYLGENVRVGAQCVLHPRVTLYAGARLGDRVILHSGVVIGSDGFGYVFSEGRHVKFPQVGGVEIEDDVEIGSNTTVDRGSLGTTTIGEGSKIDNLVQIAHNVRIGRHAVIAAQTGISGSAEIGDYVVMAGQVGLGERARLEDRVVVGGQAGILPGKTVRAGSTVWGTPARPFEQFKKIYAQFAALPALAQAVKDLRRRASRGK
jgi:UDP-3-O-[3-hydroxymyristoyl] glucosamine N-acyltransferase